MHAEQHEPQTIAEVVQEGHLRLAVLLDQIEDDLMSGGPVGMRLAQLRAAYEHHARHQEQALADHCPALLNSHRRDHDHMRALLGSLSAEHAGGGDIHAILEQIVGVFTDRLMPADAIFRPMATSARPS